MFNFLILQRCFKFVIFILLLLCVVTTGTEISADTVAPQIYSCDSEHPLYGDCEKYIRPKILCENVSARAQQGECCVAYRTFLGITTPFCAVLFCYSDLTCKELFTLDNISAGIVGEKLKKEYFVEVDKIKIEEYWRKIRGVGEKCGDCEKCVKNNEILATYVRYRNNPEDFSLTESIAQKYESLENFVKTHVPKEMDRAYSCTIKELTSGTDYGLVTKIKFTTTEVLSDQCQLGNTPESRDALVDTIRCLSFKPLLGRCGFVGQAIMYAAVYNVFACIYGDQAALNFFKKGQIVFLGTGKTMMQRAARQQQEGYNPTRHEGLPLRFATFSSYNSDQDSDSAGSFFVRTRNKTEDEKPDYYTDDLNKNQSAIRILDASESGKDIYAPGYDPITNPQYKEIYPYGMAPASSAGTDENLYGKYSDEPIGAHGIRPDFAILLKEFTRPTEE